MCVCVCVCVCEICNQERHAPCSEVCMQKNETTCSGSSDSTEGKQTRHTVCGLINKRLKCSNAQFLNLNPNP